MQQQQQQNTQNSQNHLPPSAQNQLHQAQQQPPPLNGQDYTLSSVLHFLQTEWRKYERDRNEWEIERAEMRARIALLEGERRSFDNVKMDLMRRIKMLEYALKMERSKQLGQPSSQSVPPAKLALLQSQKEDGRSHKADSSGSSPRSDDSPLPSESRAPNGTQPSHQRGAPSLGGSNWAGTGSGATGTGLGKPPPGRDPKSRARSRDYLKQCIQEVSYLTSPQAMNPLPNRPLLNNGPIPLSLPNVPSFEHMAYNGRPRKVMPEAGKDYPHLSMSNMEMLSGPSSAPAGSNMNTLERTNPFSGSAFPQQSASSSNLGQHAPRQGPSSEREGEPDGSEPQQGTAIFRPDEVTMERLRQAHEASERTRLEGGINVGANAWERRTEEEEVREEEVREEEVESDDDDTSTLMDETEGSKVWKSKRTLRNHLDAVRALAFHPAEMCLATGGDDCTVKIWRMDVNGLASSSSRATTDVEPQLTLRGHSAAITRLIHSPSKQLLYSASLDSSIRVWALPPPSHTTYAPYDESRSRGELVGHTDAVWDLALVRDESTLISCGAEGSVKVWDVSGPSGGGTLKLTWGWSGVEVQDDLHEDANASGATAVEALKTDLRKVAVAYQNAVVKIFDIESGKEVSRLQSDISYDGTPATQINRIASHPTMSLLVTAHEDKFIRIFDVTTGQCTHSMPAHLDGVTSLSIDPSGFTLISGSHDCSIRFWDLLSSRACIQEITTHREKAREGVLDVEFHSSLPFMASAGADGVVKLYASS